MVCSRPGIVRVSFMGEWRTYLGNLFLWWYKKFKVETSQQESNTQENALQMNFIVSISKTGFISPKFQKNNRKDLVNNQVTVIFLIELRVLVSFWILLLFLEKKAQICWPLEVKKNFISCPHFFFFIPLFFFFPSHIFNSSFYPLKLNM